MSEEISAPRRLFEATLARLQAGLGLQELKGEGGGPYMALESCAPVHEGHCGEVRVFTGDHIARAVSVSLVTPAIFLDSHMIFVFTDADSPIPHFTLDSVQAGEHFAFHLDLIPKTDLATNLPYINWAFAPLNDVHEASHDVEGLTRAKITPIQHAIMSPWMLVHRADLSAFENIGPLVDQYIDHWLSLLGSDVPGDVLASVADVDLKARDAANRALIFNPEVDKVWGQIGGLIGADASETIRSLLKDVDVSGARA